MDNRGFNELPALGGGERTLLVRIGDFQAKVVSGIGAALIAVFDAVWEMRQKAYERRLWAEMDHRIRHDIGAGPSGSQSELTDPTVSSYWRNDAR
ncbi:MAG TPA: hypothetical protein VGG27_11030 [Magnetospirillaceae bacterium]